MVSQTEYCGLRSVTKVNGPQTGKLITQSKPIHLENVQFPTIGNKLQH